MNNNSSGKTAFVVILLILFIIVFAGGAIGSADLTPDTPPAQQVAFDAQSAGGADAGAQTFLAQGASSSPCGAVYTVQAGDTLTRIAQACGVTLDDLLAANPSITNPHLINVGQEIAILPGLTAPVPTLEPYTDPSAQDGKGGEVALPTPEPALPQLELTPMEDDSYGPAPWDVYPADDSYGPDAETGAGEVAGEEPQAYPAAEPVEDQDYGAGDTGAGEDPGLLPEGLVPGGIINVTVKGLPPNTPLSIGVGKEGDVPTMVEDRITDDKGSLILHLAIPRSAQPGERWLVTVMTMRKPKTTVQSVPFTIQ